MDQFASAEWERTSWIESANDTACGFPLQSLPYCIFAGTDGRSRPGVGIGSFMLDLQACSESGDFADLPASVRAACAATTLNPLIACGNEAHAALRSRLMDLLGSDAKEETRFAISAALVPMHEVALLKPVDSANYTDFYASIDHATRVGRLFRPDQPLLPNYKHVPIGYHGRASSLVVGGTEIRRPCGQTKPAAGGIPGFGPSRFLDYEVEVGLYVSAGNRLGEPIPIGNASTQIFGVCLVNDWSARDIQSWEYQPLGPFLAKNFATTVSPWVVTLEALAPFRAPWGRPPGEPPPLSYLDDAQVRRAGGFDLELEVWLDTASMRAAALAPQRLSHSNFRDSWWTVSQMVTHHTVNGCNLEPGDLIGSGTQSGPAPGEAGSLLELSGGGQHPIALAGGERRTFLEDGDRVIFRAWCERPPFRRIGFGELTGTVLPARAGR